MENDDVKKESKYLEYLAETIVATRPLKAIIVKTLRDFGDRCWGRGYRRAFEDRRKFKDAQTKRQTDSWNSVKDHIDNLVHKAQPESK